MHVLRDCSAYSHLRAKYGNDLGFQRRDPSIIMTEYTPWQLPSFLCEIWETRHSARQGIARKDV